MRQSRFRVTVVAHRRFAAGAAPGLPSGLVHAVVVRAETPALARDIALVHLHADAALADAVLGVDAVLVERLRLGRVPVRELDSRRALVGS
ncbi:hypothetical protein [Kineococcus sp. NPDC059986]|uniref:hypothetical protein n=1 Tax=Kineococcus sp. NPDC059986 TaxID=3155538 RepID=UPI00344F0E74